MFCVLLGPVWCVYDLPVKSARSDAVVSAAADESRGEESLAGLGWFVEVEERKMKCSRNL